MPFGDHGSPEYLVIGLSFLSAFMRKESIEIYFAFQHTLMLRTPGVSSRGTAFPNAISIDPDEEVLPPSKEREGARKTKVVIFGHRA